jgi:hypothetical protein
VASASADAALARLRAVGVDPSSAELLGSFPVVCNFHPDRVAADGRLVVEGLLADGVYRSQFETRISNGGLSAFPGGDRDLWEASLFGGAYQQAGVTGAERPRYGGLDLWGWADGPCPRFGSCHLELRREVGARRATFTFGDSHAGPTDVGTADACLPVLAALVEDDPSAVDRLRSGPVRRPEHGRRLDEYVEAQVHGTVRLGEDAVAVTADPSFRDTPVGDGLAQLAERYGLELRWHPGFRMRAEDVPPGFRGPAVAELAARIADEWGDPLIHPARLGDVAQDVVRRPERWGDSAEALQHVKQLWHVLVAYG